MKVEKREKYSPDWAAIKRRYEGERCSVRALARDHKTTDTAIHRRAKSDGWTLFSANSAQISAQQAVQRRDQKPPKTPMLWDFETRRDALINGLKRSRNGVDGVEDAIYADLPVVMALLWLRTPFADIAKALQIDELMLEALYGKPILAFVREYFSSKPSRPRRRQRGAK